MNTEFDDNSDSETASIRKPDWIKPELISIDSKSVDGKFFSYPFEANSTVGNGS